MLTTYIRRQALARDGLKCASSDTEVSYCLMQYNPPYTLPWLRQNEIAVPVLPASDVPEAEAAVAGDAFDGEGSRSPAEDEGPADEEEGVGGVAAGEAKGAADDDAWLDAPSD